MYNFVLRVLVVQEDIFKKFKFSDNTILDTLRIILATSVTLIQSKASVSKTQIANLAQTRLFTHCIHH